MNNNISNLSYFSKPVDRVDFVSLIKTSLSIAEYRFTRQAALSWLANFPGDLLVSLLLAESMVGEGKFSQAIPALEKLITLDPEFDEVYEVLIFSRKSHQEKDVSASHKGVIKATSNRPVSKERPEWRLHDDASQKALSNKQFKEAEELSQKALLSNPDSPIPAIHQIKIARAQKDYLTVHNLAGLYHQRWPDCLQFSLYLAEAYLQVGNETRAVSLLHHCVARDSAGQVAHRLWGLDHPYKTLWPERLEIQFYLPIPANVSSRMGWNQLQAGNIELDEINSTGSSSSFHAADQSTELFSDNSQIDTHPTHDPILDAPNNPSSILDNQAQDASKEALEIAIKKQKEDALNIKDLQSIQAEFEKLANKIKKKEVIQADGRFPIYVVLSTRKGLEDQYGLKTTEVIYEQMKNLVFEVRKRPGWGSLLFFPDDPLCAASLNLKPILPCDPWKIKLSLVDLDHSLASSGERIGALLIVGGPEVVPFHHLPNPTDDGDADVPSDNPYATSDENYFIHEWPIGRLPGESGSDAGLLIEKLRKLALIHSQYARSSNNHYSPLARFIKTAITHAVGLFNRHKRHFSFGYSAEIWQEASSEVFKTIGQTKSLLTSPPLSTGFDLNSTSFPAHLGYYNLHGIQDGIDWYGQKCPDDTYNSPDYPVALSPKDIRNSEDAPEVIFSEACYGAYLNGQKSDESMALKFLSAGTSAFIGSTCISYGSVTRPLIAADLLAQCFLEQVRDGQTAGNALRRSKINLAREMSARQGYLDGEDQKTMLSFILYGDPLAELGKKNPGAKVITRSRFHPVLKTVTDRRDDSISADQLPPIIMAQIKETVNRYLPCLRDAELGLNLQSCTCKNESTQCNECKISAKGPAFRNQKRFVVTLNKEIRGYKGMHHVYARLTLDSAGKVLKISSSR